MRNSTKLLGPVTQTLWDISGPATRAELLTLLAKTADGVPITPGMTVYRANQSYVMGRRAIAVREETFTAMHGTLRGQEIATFYGYRFYSTEDAAGKAADEEADREARRTLFGAAANAKGGGGGE